MDKETESPLYENSPANLVKIFRKKQNTVMVLDK